VYRAEGGIMIEVGGQQGALLM